MKKLLIFALVAAAAIGCERSITPGGEELNPSGETIALSSGSPSLAAVGSRAVNKGDRVHFEVGDQLGIFAAYEKIETPPADSKPDWSTAPFVVTDPATVDPQTGRYFDNKPAACNVAGSSTSDATPVVTPATFNWGADAEGGVDNNQTYPKGDNPIYVYAYYPYDDNVTNVTIDVATGPAIKLTLNEGTMVATNMPENAAEGAFTSVRNTVAITADDFVPTQSDVLHTRGTTKVGVTPEPEPEPELAPAITRTGTPADPVYLVRRNDKLAVLTFKHALAQLQIKLVRPEGSRISSYDKVEFTTFYKGTMTLTTGAITPTLDKTTLEGDQKLTYVITPNLAPAEPKVMNVDIPTDVANPLVLLNKPMMLLPLVLADFQKCALTVWLKFDDDKDSDAAKPFIVPLDKLTNFDLQKGKLNILTLTLAETGITLTGAIAKWDPTANSTEIEIE